MQPHVLAGGFSPVWMAPVLFVVVGGIFAVLGLVGACSHIAFRRRAVRCRGVVTAFREKWSHGSGDSPGRMLYYPILAFRTADGLDVQTEGRTGKSWRGYRPGQEIAITYDRRDPSHAYPGSGASALVVSLVLAGAGAAFAVMGLVVLFGDGVWHRLLFG